MCSAFLSAPSCHSVSVCYLSGLVAGVWLVWWGHVKCLQDSPARLSRGYKVLSVGCVGVGREDVWACVVEECMWVVMDVGDNDVWGWVVVKEIAEDYVWTGCVPLNHPLVPRHRWPSPYIPLEVSEEFNHTSRQGLRRGAQQLEAGTCIRFVKVTRP
ncbi:hypothetical protein Pcinc_037922 [Petrolisthes cinctipes]|uniref:Uncharacterized protein n=1 Tax=Petrolisthes cinctipes TaxID=88211 RepID=A0AAE1BRI5_PETCI|nr:hypothetical protein Pcinc_037922 [Petrolisthes cinctipes]